MRNLAIYILLLISGLSNAQDVTSLIIEGKKLKTQFKDEESIVKFEEALKKEPENIEALQLASYQLSITGERKKTKEEKQKYFERAKSYAEKAVKLDPQQAESHYDLALALGRISLLADSEEKLKNAKLIKSEAEKAIALDPKHAGAYHILGRLNREIANMSAIKVMAAKALYGGIPEDCTFTKANDYFQKAIALNPKYILYYYDAALNFDYMNKKAEAKKLLEKALTLPMSTPDDPYRINDCKRLLEKLR
jgi:tetratricopeptide (TPR) repeat protein